MMQEEAEAKEASEKEEEQKAIKSVLKEGGVLVLSSEDIEGLSSRGYGRPENGDLLLSFCEALYLLSKGIVEVKDEKTKSNVTFQELLERARAANGDAWVRYLIYRDLRSRGYVVREGFGLGIDFRVYKRGEYGKSTADYLILGIQEGQPVIVEDLARILTRVQSLKKTLILSVLNRRGEIVYYSLSQLVFK
ncbi:MAG: tRNA-intron lyase [Candidatus Bathyarchaeota archaeon]|nr:tRNA-intron lyase [Candidatus Bathyarchaeota archaeon]